MMTMFQRGIAPNVYDLAGSRHAAQYGLRLLRPWAYILRELKMLGKAQNVSDGITNPVRLWRNISFHISPLK